MIIDSSAMVAILQGETEATAFVEAISKTKHRLVPSPIFLETCMVYCGRRPATSISEVNELVRLAKLEIVPFQPAAASIAAEAFLKYGKGRGHAAQLNFGDCISYAVSKLEMMPLLFKGDDFRLTDVECAI